MFYEEVGLALRRLRKLRKLSMAQVARRIGKDKPKQQIDNMEKARFHSSMVEIELAVEALKGRLFVDVRPAEEALEPTWVSPSVRAIAEAIASGGTLDAEEVRLLGRLAAALPLLTREDQVIYTELFERKAGVKKPEPVPGLDDQAGERAAPANDRRKA